MDLTIHTAQRLAATTSAPSVLVFDGSKPDLPQVSSQELRTSSNSVMRDTAKVATEVMQFLGSEFGRNGLDGKGSALRIAVHVADPFSDEPGLPMNNAFWDGQSGMMYIGDGDGRMFSPLGRAKDIVAHEIGHAILESHVNMGFTGEQGALHESFGDVIGALVDPGDWQIGEDAFTPKTPGDAMRDMSKPDFFSHVKDAGPHLREGEPHMLADIPNLAAVRAAEQLGRSEMGKVWYEGFTKHLRDNAGFSDAAIATVKAAEELYGTGSKQAAAVTDAWKSVGVLTTSYEPKRAA